MTKRRHKKDKRWAFIKFCLLAYIFMGLFALISLRTKVFSLEYELGQLENQKIELMRETQKLSAERASIYSVGKIEKVASKKLGMGFPKRERVFFVNKTAGPAPYRASVKSDIDNDSSGRKRFKKIIGELE